MFQIASRLLYKLRFLVILVWGLSAFWFWLLVRIPILAWLAALPAAIARVAIMPISNMGLVILGCMLLGASSVLLWRYLPTKLAASLAILIPMLLVAGSLRYGRVDSYGTESYVTNPAQQGDLQTTREQLLIQMARYSMTNELRSLIRVGTDADARDPEGRSALYWSSGDLETANMLLQAGTKPDGEALVEAAFWGRADMIELLFAATSDDGKAMVAEVGDRALDANSVSTGPADEPGRQQIVQMLLARGAKPSS